MFPIVVGALINGTATDEIATPHTPPSVQQFIQVNQQINLDSTLSKAYGHCFGEVDQDVVDIEAELDDNVSRMDDE